MPAPLTNGQQELLSGRRKARFILLWMQASARWDR